MSEQYCSNCKYSEPMCGALCCMGQKGMPSVRPTDSCDGWKSAKQNNSDRIRAMSDEELAVQLALPYLTSPPWCSEHRSCPYISEDPTPCDKCALDWLKQEVTDEGH